MLLCIRAFPSNSRHFRTEMYLQYLFSIDTTVVLRNLTHGAQVDPIGLQYTYRNLLLVETTVTQPHLTHRSVSDLVDSRYTVEPVRA